MARVSGAPSHCDDPVEAMREVIKQNHIDDRRFPFMGGLVGYFSFEFARYLEKKTPFLRDDSFPDYELGFYKEAVVYDHSRFQCHYLSVDGCDNLRRILDKEVAPEGGEAFLAGKTTDLDPRHDYERNVSLAKQRISDGEAFQVVVSRQKEMEFAGDPLSLYEALRQVNPSPYMFYLDFGERKVLGSSPETLVTVKRDEVITYPIAGTRPIGATMRERRALKEEMQGDEKERAEHAMLVDLARNDLGKVCEEGSVHVAEYMQVEEFSHVQHLVSKVQGTLDAGQGRLGRLLRLLPGRHRLRGAETARHGDNRRAGGQAERTLRRIGRLPLPQRRPGLGHRHPLRLRQSRPNPLPGRRRHRL